MSAREIAKILWNWIDEAIRAGDYDRAALLSLDLAIVNRLHRLEN